ncbi:MAG TPA: glycosyltransferase [Bacteroidia bacterium]|jgi:glycosyltransferase involved in cell wall biosynthesis|nr:glycosyltransferase [Bacteroidia bacterium]
MGEVKDFILLIPYYNDFEGLIESLKSIKYPFDKFEVLVVDDGSKVPLSLAHLQNLFPETEIKVINLPLNVGIAKALNSGLREILNRTDYKYIARLDCGDTCDIERFTKQVQFMNTHEDIGLLGTWCTFTDKGSGKSYVYKTKLTHNEIIKEMHFKCSFIHPTVMFRREVLEKVGLYPENYPHTEDYAYFWKILKYYTAAILPLYLVDVSTGKNTVSFSNRKEQLIWRKKIVSEMSSDRINKISAFFYLTILSIIPGNLIYLLKFKLLEK